MALKLEKDLSNWLYGMKKLVIVGLGNRLRGDDAIGLELINTLKGRVGDNIFLIEAETTPESYTDVISSFKPTHILFVDAAQFNKKPGYTRLISMNEIADLPLSTHSISLDTLARYLSQSVSAKIALLGIQPKCIDFKEELTREAEEAVKKAGALLSKLIKKKGLTY
ncbi:MAG: hydrogenase maturation peptidase HycI [Nitrososphaerales archaeon]